MFRSIWACILVQLVLFPGKHSAVRNTCASSFARAMRLNAEKVAGVEPAQTTNQNKSILDIEGKVANLPSKVTVEQPVKSTTKNKSIADGQAECHNYFETFVGWLEDKCRIKCGRLGANLIRLKTSANDFLNLVDPSAVMSKALVAVSLWAYKEQKKNSPFWEDYKNRTSPPNRGVPHGLQSVERWIKKVWKKAPYGNFFGEEPEQEAERFSTGTQRAVLRYMQALSKHDVFGYASVLPGGFIKYCEDDTAKTKDEKAETIILLGRQLTALMKSLNLAHSELKRWPKFNQIIAETSGYLMNKKYCPERFDEEVEAPRFRTKDIDTISSYFSAAGDDLTTKYNIDKPCIKAVQKLVLKGETRI